MSIDPQRLHDLADTLDGDDWLHPLGSADLCRAAADELERLRALADCCGELDADNVKTCSVPSWMRVRSYVVAQIQDAWLHYKQAAKEGA